MESRTVEMCIEEELLQYRIRVSGNSGCNQFLQGDPARAAGSAAKPPVAVATPATAVLVTVAARLAGAATTA